MSFRLVVLEMCDRQTDRRTHHNTWLPTAAGVITSESVCMVCSQGHAAFDKWFYTSLFFTCEASVFDLQLLVTGMVNIKKLY